MTPLKLVLLESRPGPAPKTSASKWMICRPSTSHGAGWRSRRWRRSRNGHDLLLLHAGQVLGARRTQRRRWEIKMMSAVAPPCRRRPHPAGAVRMPRRHGTVRGRPAADLGSLTGIRRPADSCPPGRRIRKKVSGATKTEVLRKLRDLRFELNAGLPVPGDRLTVAGFLDRWLTGSLPGQVSEKTLDSYADTVRLHIAPSLGRKVLRKLT